MGWVLFSFHLQRSSPKSSLTERSTYLVRISAPRPVGETGGAISPGRVRSATPYFSDCPNQCAALYLVRILSAARCAGFRQAKSPGRVGQSQTDVRGFFSLCLRSFLPSFRSCSARSENVLRAAIKRALWAGFKMQKILPL